MANISIEYVCMSLSSESPLKIAAGTISKNIYLTGNTRQSVQLVCMYVRKNRELARPYIFPITYVKLTFQNRKHTGGQKIKAGFRKFPNNFRQHLN